MLIVPLAGLGALIAAPAEAMIYEPQVQMGEQRGSIAIENNLRPIGDYIKNIYRYAIGGVGILATVVMMFGGFVWITAGGNASRVGDAKAWIGAALSGLVLALASYLILNTINPALVNFNDQEIRTVPTTPADNAAAPLIYQKDCSVSISYPGPCPANYTLSTDESADCPNRPAGQIGNCCCNNILTPQ